MDTGEMGNARLSWTQKIGYGSGDFAFNLYWQGVSLYLFYFYTDVLGLPNAMAGIIYAMGSLWDAVTDRPWAMWPSAHARGGAGTDLICCSRRCRWPLAIC